MNRVHEKYSKLYQFTDKIMTGSDNIVFIVRGAGHNMVKIDPALHKFDFTAANCKLAIAGKI